MKKILFALLLLSSSCFIYAQEEIDDTEETDDTKVTSQHIDQFFKSKTYIVLDDNPMSDYNSKIEENVKKYWTVTPFELINQATFLLKRTDPKNSFIILSETVFIKDNLQARYDFFSLLLGGNYAVIKQMPVLGAIPIGYTGAPQESSMYKLGAILKFLQAHTLLLKEHPEILENKNMFKYYNDNQKSVAEKTLYLVKEEQTTEFNSKPKIATVYPYKVQFVTREELEEAIDQEKEGIVFLHKVGPEGTKKKARCYKMIIGTDKVLYYFDWHMITEKKPDGLLEKDFKNLAKFKNK